MTHRPAETRQPARRLARSKEHCLFQDFLIIVVYLESALPVDAEGDVIERVFTREIILVEQNAGTETFAHLNSENRAWVLS